MTDRDALVSECELPDPPAKVWRALTEPELLSRWLLPAAATADGHLRLDAGPGLGGTIDAQVIEAEPPRRLTYRWRGTALGLDSVVTFDLAPTLPGGTRLRIVHSGFAPQAANRRAANANRPPLLAAA